MRQPNTVCASGIFEAFQRALSYQHSKLFIGFGCDGANVNMGDNGVKGLIQSDKPWVVTVRCFAHRLEQAIKDALKKMSFQQLNFSFVCISGMAAIVVLASSSTAHTLLRCTMFSQNFLKSAKI